MRTKDYYKILDVPETADNPQIKKRYRELAKQYHPDANSGNKQAEDRFKAIAEAYDVLGDPQKKQKYDHMRKYSRMGGLPGGGGGGGFDFRRYNSGGSPISFDSSNIFDGLGSLFSQFFDSSNAPRRKRRDSGRGQDVQVQMSIPFETSITGGKYSISVEKEIVCPACEGGGAKPGSRVEACSNCKGSGTVVLGQGGFGVSRPCPRCFGSGQIIANPCDRCKGSGKAKGTRTYSVKVPAGIEDGGQIRLKGQGRPGSIVGKEGDMLITVRVKPHRFFRRNKRDIHCEISIKLVHAFNGTKVKVNTSTGKKVQINIPPLTQNGTVLRLTDMGIQENGRKGDQLVTVNIKMPDNPSEEEIEMIAKLSKENAV